MAAFRHYLSLSLSVSLLVVAACKDDKGMTGNIDKKKASASDAQAAAAGGDPTVPDINPNDVLPPGASVINAVYIVNVKTFGVKCDGKLQMKVKASFDKNAKMFDVPYGKVKCGGLASLAGIGEIDIAKMMGALTGGKDYTTITVKDNVFRLKGLGPFAFKEPYRPFIPSFLAATKEQLQAISINNEPVTVIDSRSKVIATGTSSMSVTDFDTPFPLSKNPEGLSLPDTFKITTQSDGFKNFDRISSFLFDKMEMTMSLKPIAIAKIHLETHVRDLMKSTENSPDLPKIPGGAVGGLLVGGIKVVIDIELMDQQGLKHFLEMQDKQTSGDTPTDTSATTEDTSTGG